MTIRVEKILVGTPTYKVLVGNVTRLNKIVVGTPLTTVVIGPYADIDNIVGLNTSGKIGNDGGIIAYDSDTGSFIVTDSPKIEVDGKFYPTSVYGDSDHTNILIRRSGTQGQPSILQQGELAYSFLADPGTDGFGNGGDRLYIATGANDVDGNSTQIEVIGGTYFTDMMNHQQGVLTPGSALIVGDDKYINEFFVDSATFTKLTLIDLFVQDITLTASRIKAASGSLTSLDGLNSYLDWGNSNDELVGYGSSLVGAGSRRSFDTRTKNVSGISGSLDRPNGDVSTLTVPNALDVIGYTFLDSTFVSGDLEVVGNFSLTGNLATMDVDRLTLKDRRIVIARGAANAVAADQAGIAVGDSSAPYAMMTYNNNASYDSATWVFNPGIEAPFIKTDRFEFEFIDCGKYA
tara:strand:+ start:3723 stop:4937 length:1215 start_codon:yes stop_codon:yes gene_type:complete